MTEEDEGKIIIYANKNNISKGERINLLRIGKKYSGERDVYKIEVIIENDEFVYDRGDTRSWFNENVDYNNKCCVFELDEQDKVLFNLEFNL
jgi:hypothetical protein